MSKGRKNNHYHYAEKFEPKSRYMRKKRAVYVPRKAVLFSLLVLIVVGLISTTFAANFGGSSNDQDIRESNTLIAQARTAKMNRDLAGTGVVVDLAGTGWGVQGGKTIYFVNTNAWTTVYQHFWGSNWSNYVQMTQISDTGVYYKSYTNDYTSDAFNFLSSETNTQTPKFEDWVTADKAYTPTTAFDDLTKLNSTAKVISMVEPSSGNSTYAKTANADCVATVSSVNISGTSTSASTASTGGEHDTVECYPAYGATVNYTAEATGGYEFKGFSTTNSSSLPNDVASTKSVTSLGYNGSAAPVDVYAYFALKRYTVAYNAGTYGTGSVASTTKTHGINVALSGSTFTRTGYTQTGWNTADDGSGTHYALSAAYTADEAVTLYPEWTINTYAVTITESGQTGGVGGTFSVDGSAFTSGGSIAYGTHTFIITAPADHKVTAVSIGGAAQSIIQGTSVTLSNVSISAATTITVTYAETGVCTLSLSSNSATLNLGDTTTFTVTPNKFHTSGGTISATSNNSNIATVSESEGTYTVQAVGVGSTTITVSCTDTGSLSATFTVTVNTPEFTVANITGVQVNEVLTPADTDFTYNYPAVKTGTVSYTSDDTNISIDGENITALSPGTATVTARYHYYINSQIYYTTDPQNFTITIDAPSFSVADIQIEECKSGTLTAVDTDGLYPTFSWSENSELISLSAGETAYTKTVNTTKLSAAAALSANVADRRATVTLTATYNAFYHPSIDCTVTVTPSPYYILGFDTDDDNTQPNWSYLSAFNERRMTWVSGSTYQSGDIALTNGSHTGEDGFKICVVNYSNNSLSWYGNDTGMTVESHDNLAFTTGEDNCSITANPAGDYTFSLNTSNMQVTANYPSSKTVTFVDSLKNTSTPVLVNTEKTMTASGASAPADPTVSGYTFVGWKDSADDTVYSKTEVEGRTYTEAMGNVTYSAVYTLDKPTVTITPAQDYVVGDSAALVKITCSSEAASYTTSATFTTANARKSNSQPTPDGVDNVTLTPADMANENEKGVYFSATIPAQYEITCSVTISDGTRTATADLKQTYVTVRPAAPTFSLTISNFSSGTGTEADPYVATLGSDIAYKAQVTSTTPAVAEGYSYMYSWYQSSGGTDSPITGFQSDPSASGNSKISFQPFHAKSVSPQVGISVKCLATYNGFSSEKSSTEETWYKIDSWISSFDVSPSNVTPVQKIYDPEGVLSLTLSATYNALLDTAINNAKDFESAVVFSNNTPNVSLNTWRDVDLTSGKLTEFTNTLQHFLRTSGVKYFYLSTREYQTENSVRTLDYEVRSDLKHTTVGSTSTAASKPFYYSDNVFSLSSYRVTAFWVETVEEESVLKFQHMQPLGTGMYRAYLPADITGVIIAASDQDNYYAMPTLNENGGMVFSEPYFVYVTNPISLATSGTEFVNGYNLFTVGSSEDLGDDNSKLEGGTFYDNVSGELTKLLHS